METSQNTELRGFYVSHWLACVPLLIMVLPAIVLSLKGVLSSDIMIAGGIVGLMLGSLMARDKGEYWQQVTRSLADPTGLLVFALFLIVGIYGKLLSVAQLANGLIWLSGQLDVGPAMFALFVYVVCSVLGTAMGTSVGIVVIMTPVLFPAAVAMGVHPIIAAGTILSGAATGDHFAPVSDTTIISSSTQHYKSMDRCADVGGVVKARLKYVIPAFLLSCLLYLIVAKLSAQPTSSAASELIQNARPEGLAMLLPMVVVISSAIFGRSVFEALTYGILSGFVIAFGFDLIEWQHLFSIQDRQVKGILVEGAVDNLDTVVMIVLMMGAYGVMRAYGVLDLLISKARANFGATPRSTELAMFGVGWLLNFALVGLVARITVIAGPIFDELGRAQNLHPYRRANLLDGVANSFSFIIPWHVWPLFMIMTITPLLDVYPFLTLPAPTDFLISTFYPVIIWLVMLTAVITGYGRRFEEAKLPVE